jgi:hypothetical protein
MHHIEYQRALVHFSILGGQKQARKQKQQQSQSGGKNKDSKQEKGKQKGAAAENRTADSTTDTSKDVLGGKNAQSNANKPTQPKVHGLTYIASCIQVRY